MITRARFRLLEVALRKRGYGPMIEWSETIVPASNADEFAERATYVICNSGMANNVAIAIYTRCVAALKAGKLAADVFGHPGKASAIDEIWNTKHLLFAEYNAAPDQLAFLDTLPFIGPITAHHLAKNLGMDTAKPDVHLERLARRERVDSQTLCARLSNESGYRVATIDSILWRACADRILRSAIYEQDGWDAAFNPDE